MSTAEILVDRIQRLADENGITINTLLKDCGINKSLLSDLKSKGSIPSADKLSKIADYLDVSTDYLLGRTDARRYSDDPMPAYKSPSAIHYYSLQLRINLQLYASTNNKSLDKALERCGLERFVDIDDYNMKSSEALSISIEELQTLADYFNQPLDLLLQFSWDHNSGFDSKPSNESSVLQTRLKEIRKACDFTQQQVADHFNIDQSTYAGYESGKSVPSPERLAALADYFDVSVDYLLGRTEVRRYGEIAAASSDTGYDLPPEALEELAQYREFLRQKYKK